MLKSRVVGVVICVATIVLGAAFIWGIIARSYWAIAVPVLIGLLSVLALAFWIGWTMAVTEIEPPPQLPEEGNPSTSA
ncbi:MAG: hypothetical protein SV910_02040 [Chloroflexota bacterium]|nr:hypothetical protein [Chloroflexota bacterium]